MQLTSQEVFITFLAAFAMSAALTPFFRRFAINRKIFDIPLQEHKTHSEPIPYLGGFSIIATFSLGLFASIIFKENSTVNFNEVLILIIAPLLLALIGLIDDLKNLSAKSRFLVQSVSATILAMVFMEMSWYGQPTTIKFLNVVVSIVWIVGITNSLNLIDNLDGGAGGIAVVTSGTLVIASLASEQLALAATFTLITGATLGFLIWNLHPAKIYLGDAGALFLGSLLAVLTLRFDPATSDLFSGWLFAILVFAVPILDTSLVVISRVQRNLSPFQGGRDHISHRLLRSGLSKRNTALIIWTLQLYFSLLGLLLFVLDNWGARTIEFLAVSSWLLLLGYFLRLSPVSVEEDNNHK